MTRRHILWGFAFLGLLVAMSAAGVGLFYWRLSTGGPSDAATVILIERGDSVAAIGRTLKDDGVIDQPRLFRLAVRWKGAGRRLRAGEYEIPAGASLFGVVETLTTADPIQRRLTVPEGLTSREVIALVRAAPKLTGEVAAIPDEGRLLPETYFYVAGETRETLLRRMKKAMDEAVEAAWAARRPEIAIASPEAMVTLASIIEKETGVPGERDRVSAVFHNRLKRGMRLQSDPTVIYAVAGAEGLGRPLTRDDLESEDAYNTYRNGGLPPGPIANPGRAALKAAVQPAESDALYFVADGTGGHAFARTLREHNANVARWRRYREEAQTPSDDG